MRCEKRSVHYKYKELKPRNVKFCFKNVYNVRWSVAQSYEVQEDYRK